MSRLTILSYHNVEGTWAFPSAPGAGLRGFRDQLDWLTARANVVRLEESLQALAAGERLPARAVAITFDDGYRDNLDLAADELRRRRLPATFYLVPGLIDRSVRPWWEVVAWALRCGSADTLTWEGRTVVLRSGAGRGAFAREVARSMKRVDRAERETQLDELITQLRPGPQPDFGGLYVDAAGARGLADAGFHVGSHSSWHAILSQETPQEQAADLAGSRSHLEGLLQRPVLALAYPNGTSSDYSPATVDAARAAGFTSAVTTRVGFNTPATPPLELRRLVVMPERGTSVLAWSSALGARGVRVARRRLAGRARPAGPPPTGGADSAPVAVP
ncbi:MAG: polysaccharide deacetylase family protein [Thermoleophilia bacterium]